FFLEIEDRPTGVVELPMHWELDDFPYFMFNYTPPFPAGQGRIASYSQVLNTWKTEFNGYYDLGLCFVLVLHPETIGTPGRVQLLEELIEHMRSKPGVWFATGAEVSEWWRTLGRQNDPGSPAQVFAHARRD